MSSGWWLEFFIQPSTMCVRNRNHEEISLSLVFVEKTHKNSFVNFDNWNSHKYFQKLMTKPSNRAPSVLLYHPQKAREQEKLSLSLFIPCFPHSVIELLSQFVLVDCVQAFLLYPHSLGRKKRKNAFSSIKKTTSLQSIKNMKMRRHKMLIYQINHNRRMLAEEYWESEGMRLEGFIMNHYFLVYY